MLVVPVYLDPYGCTESRTLLARMAIANVGEAERHNHYEYVWTLSEKPLRSVHAGVAAVHGRLIARRSRPASALVRDALLQAFDLPGEASLDTAPASGGLARFIRENLAALERGEV